jgi:hypothetical protein
VIDTIQLHGAVELSADLDGAIDPAFIKDYGSQAYRHVHVPNAIDTALVPTEEFGTFINTFHGWDVVPHDLVSPGIVGDGLFAMIDGPPVDPTRVFQQKRRTVAQALFDAMTLATEVRTDHVVPPEHVYDRSWTRTRRATAAGRLTCDKVVFPDSGPDATYTCVLSKVDWKTVQAFDPADAGGFCPSP